MSRLILLLLSLLIATHAHAGVAPELSPRPISARMLDYGLYEAERSESIADDNVAGGLIATNGIKLVKLTDQVPTALGTNFGFRYSLSGSGSKLTIRVRVTHPVPLRDPNTGRTFGSSEWRESVPIGPVVLNTGWIFEKSWEVVLGEWKIQLYSGDVMLLEKTFFVTEVPGR